MSQSDLHGKTALITGAASGLGLAIARRLAADGASVTLADINPAGAAIAKEIGGLFVHADLALRADCRALADAALAPSGIVHILINNAGFQHIAPIADFPEDVWEQMQAVMLTAPFLLKR